MSADEAVLKLAPGQRPLMVIMVMLGTTIYTASILISSALLPQMQGAFAATQDEISWTMTFNIVATAVMTPMTGWLSDRFGRRQTMFWCAVIFTIATLFCGLAGSLEEMILWRVIQGAAGAPLVPLGQTILLDAYPRRQHGSVISFYGMANMIGPVLGPTLGGQISEAFGWRWGFWMIMPVALVACIGFWFVLPRDRPEGKVKLDWTGFITLSVAIAAAQLVFSRGQRLDWFQSTEVWISAFLAITAIYMFTVHALTTDRPFIRLKLLSDRNYALGLALVFLYGMLNFAPIVLLPPLLQQHANYPDSAIGAFVGWRGAGAAIGFLIAMFTSRVDPRAMMVFGSLLQAYAGWSMMSLDLNIDTRTLAFESFLQGVSIGVAWVPMTVVTFSTLQPQYRAEAMSMFHLLRNFGSSLFISVAVAEIVRTSGANYARMTELASYYNRVWDLPWVSGAWSMETAAGLARLSREINRQATVIGYQNAFLMYTIVALAAVPLCLLAKLPRAEAKPADKPVELEVAPAAGSDAVGHRRS